MIKIPKRSASTIANGIKKFQTIVSEAEARDINESGKLGSLVGR
jgi:hypothetical protein